MNKRKKRILFPYFDDKIARRVPTRSTSFLFFFSSFVVVNIMLVDNHVGKKVKTRDKGIRSNGGEKYWPIIIRVDISTI